MYISVDSQNCISDMYTIYTYDLISSPRADLRVTTQRYLYGKMVIFLAYQFIYFCYVCARGRAQGGGGAGVLTPAPLELQIQKKIPEPPYFSKFYLTESSARHCLF